MRWTRAQQSGEGDATACQYQSVSRRDIAETIVRANYGLRVGKFEMDFEDGELRFHASQILDGDAVGTAVIDRMIGTAVNMMDTYLPAFISVVYGNEQAGDAIRRVEVTSASVDTA